LGREDIDVNNVAWYLILDFDTAYAYVKTELFFCFVYVHNFSV
jgi:hypothetical protein